MGRILVKGDIAAATSGQATITSAINAFNTIKSELINFVNNQELKGQGWDSARNVVNNVFRVLNDAFIMWGELILEANGKLSAASDKLKNDFIDEDALKLQIAMIKSNIVTVQYEMQAAQMYPASTPAGAAAAASMASACQYRIRELEKQQKKIQEELDSLDAFDSATSGIYSEAIALQNKINGLLRNVINKGIWSTSTGLFTTSELKAAYKGLKTELEQQKIRQSLTSDNDIFMVKILMKSGNSKVEAEKIVSEFNKVDKGEYFGKSKKVEVTDDIRAISITYNKGGVGYSYSVVINETTNTILSQSAGGVTSEFELNNFVERIPNNGDMKELQDTQRTSMGIGQGIAGVTAGLVTQSEINHSLKMTTNTIKGKKYLENLAKEKKATEEAAEQRAKQDFDSQHFQGSPLGQGATPND